MGQPLDWSFQTAAWAEPTRPEDGTASGALAGRLQKALIDTDS